MLLAIHLGIVALFLVLGIVFLKGKGALLIAGYNTASPEEKARIDEKKLCRYMGRMMLALAACWLVLASSEIFQTMVLFWVGFALFFVVIIVGIIFLNTGGRIQR